MPAADAVSAAADREAPPLDRAVARAAAGWAVRLRERASAEDLAACASWARAGRAARVPSVAQRTRIDFKWPPGSKSMWR
ncbi:hypothetical protein QZM99_25935, partial [Burkholderia gladioli]|nr:hypothetical protein [Burkholderia gladioli]